MKMMHRKKGYLIINPHGGQDLTRFPDIMTVFAAAGWEVDNVLIEYGGQELTLTKKALSANYDVLIAHGGDGTISKIMEAIVMNEQDSESTKSKDSKENKEEKVHNVLGALSGGTANQWVHEIGYPTDPVQAALALINSDIRYVDVGRISVENVIFPAAQHQKQKAHKKAHAKGAHYFLLTAGFGIDAAIISHTSKTLKERIGSLAYEVAATKELPEQHPFYVEISPVGETKQTSQNDSVATQANNEQVQQEGQQDKAWHGKAIQIVVGNTRRYGDEVELNPNAYIDDGRLDICVMTDEGAVKVAQQVTSLLLRKKPDNTSTIALQEAHFTITLPAHVGIQLDGGSIELRHFLSTSEQDALEHQTDPSQVLVTYRIDTLPQVLAVSVPRTYNNTLFSHSLNASPVTPVINTSQPSKVLTEQTLTQTQIDTLIRKSQRVTIVGIVPDQSHPQSYIIAGTTQKARREDITPVAMCINTETPIHTSNGEPRLPRDLQTLQSGSILHIVGDANKRGVVQVEHIIL